MFCDVALTVNGTLQCHNGIVSQQQRRWKVKGHSSRGTAGTFLCEYDTRVSVSTYDIDILSGWLCFVCIYSSNMSWNVSSFFCSLAHVTWVAFCVYRTETDFREQLPPSLIVTWWHCWFSTKAGDNAAVCVVWRSVWEGFGGDWWNTCFVIRVWGLLHISVNCSKTRL